MKLAKLFTLLSLLVLVTACQDDPFTPQQNERPTGEEWYPGGLNGTVFMANSKSYRQPMPFIEDDAELYRSFMRGEYLFEKSYVASNDDGGYSGLGPVYIRRSCIACHPSYGGRSKRVDEFDTSNSQNGYLLMIYDPDSPTLALASKYFTGMTQTRAVAPFKAPIDEKGVKINWHTHVDDFDNKYEDGTPYSADYPYAGTLIYPTVEIDQNAILFEDFDMSKHAACLEATIGIYGTGLIDAISDDDLRAEYAAQQGRPYAGIIGADIVETEATNKYFPGPHPGRFTYLCTRGTLDNGPGANAFWNITNVTRPDRTYNYITEEYARVMSKDPDVQQALGQREEQIFADLMSKNLQPEMTQGDYDDFMVWHRAVAVPAARNLDDEIVKRGKELFASSGCAACHKPKWKTRGNYTPMPELSNQTIYPYLDFLRHDLGLKEPGRAGVCRTTPLWGRGLMQVNSGHTDMLHDLRARNYEEAILWHEGQALGSKKKFRAMPKEDRQALIKFLESI